MRSLVYTYWMSLWHMLCSFEDAELWSTCPPGHRWCHCQAQEQGCPSPELRIALVLPSQDSIDPRFSDAPHACRSSIADASWLWWPSKLQLHRPTDVCSHPAESVKKKRKTTSFSPLIPLFWFDSIPQTWLDEYNYITMTFPIATLSKSLDPTVEFLALWSSKFLSVMETGSNTGTQKIAVYRQMKKAAKQRSIRNRIRAAERKVAAPLQQIEQPKKCKVRLWWDTGNAKGISYVWIRDRKHRKFLNQIQPVFLDHIFTNKLTEWNCITLQSAWSLHGIFS